MGQTKSQDAAIDEDGNMVVQGDVIIKSAVQESPSQPMFQRLCVDFLTKDCLPLVNNRGNDYGDTIGHNQWLYLKAVAKKLGLDLSTAQCRLFTMAGMADIKYQRMEGGFRVDHVADGINYESVVPQLLTEAMQEIF